MLAKLARSLFADQPCDKCGTVRPLAELTPVVEAVLVGWVCAGGCE